MSSSFFRLLWFIVERHGAAVLVATALITLAAAVHLPRVGFSNEVEIWFVEGDEDLATYRQFLERFQADEILVAGLFSDDMFTPPRLAALRRLTGDIEQSPLVHRVRSLSNVRVARGDADTITLEALLPRGDISEEVASRARDRALSVPLLVGNLVSSDGRAAAIVIELSPGSADFAGKAQLVEALRDLGRREQERDTGLRVRLAGTPVQDAAFYNYSFRDFLLFGPLSAVVVGGLLLAFFGRCRWVALCLVVAGLAQCWLFGLMGVLGLSITMITAVLPAVIVAIGVADAVHILCGYEAAVRRGMESAHAVRDALRRLLMPCFFTAATTAAAFSSLLISDLPPIRQFGVLAALGVGFAFVLSVVVLPVALLRMRPAPSESAPLLDPVVNGGLRRLQVPSPRRDHAVLLVVGVLFLAGLPGLAKLEVSVNPTRYFLADDPVRVDAEAIDRELGGATSLEFLVETGPGGLKDPATLRRFDELAQWLDDRPGIVQVLSVVDALKDINRVWHGSAQGHYVLPDTREKIAQFYLLLESEGDFSSIVQDDYSVGRLTARVQVEQARALRRALPDIEAHIEETFADSGIEVTATGYVKLMANMGGYLIDSQIRGFALAFAIITAMMFVTLRSAGLTALSLVPNLAPIAMVLAFMGWMGIALDLATVMIATLAIGLVVDDSVHFLTGLRSRIRAGLDQEAAITGTLEECGRPIVITSVVLAAGFAVLMFSRFNPTINFGSLSALTILLAMLADLVVLPALLRRWHRRRAPN